METEPTAVIKPPPKDDPDDDSGNVSHQTGVIPNQGSRHSEEQVSGQSNSMNSGEKCSDTKATSAYIFGAIAVLNRSSVGEPSSHDQAPAVLFRARADRACTRASRR